MQVFRNCVSLSHKRAYVNDDLVCLPVPDAVKRPADRGKNAAAHGQIDLGNTEEQTHSQNL